MGCEESRKPIFTPVRAGRILAGVQSTPHSSPAPYPLTAVPLLLQACPQENLGLAFLWIQLSCHANLFFFKEKLPKFGGQVENDSVLNLLTLCHQYISLETLVFKNRRFFSKKNLKNPCKICALSNGQEQKPEYNEFNKDKWESLGPRNRKAQQNAPFRKRLVSEFHDLRMLLLPLQLLGPPSCVLTSFSGRSGNESREQGLLVSSRFKWLLHLVTSLEGELLFSKNSSKSLGLGRLRPWLCPPGRTCPPVTSPHGPIQAMTLPTAKPTGSGVDARG